METNKSSFVDSFKRWFGIGALMFGTCCGASMASGVYASAYIVTLGGGWALVWLAMYFAFMAFFCSISLNFIRAYKISNYNHYFLSLYGLNKPDSNPILKGIVTVFFDVYTTLMGIVTTAATIALFSELLNSLLGVPTFVASLIGVALFAGLTIYGAGFLRKFNTAMTISLIVSLLAILVAVIVIRGDVLVQRIGNFQEGIDWGGTTVAAHFAMFLSYCWNTSAWGSTLSSYADQIKTKRDAIGSGLTIGILVTLLYAVTGAIVLPFMPEALSGTPILMICQNYLSPVLTVIYWVVVIFSVVSTAPTFTYVFSDRWSTVWKGDIVPRKLKFLILSLGYLLVCWLISNIGLMAIVQKGFVMLGSLALYGVVAPLLISIVRVWKKDKAEKEAGKTAEQA